jgi:hypothetical protein
LETPWALDPPPPGGPHPLPARQPPRPCPPPPVPTCRDRRDETGKRGVAGRVSLVLAASAAPGWEGWLASARVLLAYAITPLPLAMATSSIAGSSSVQQRDAEARHLVTEWLAGVTPPIPATVVKRVRGAAAQGARLL